MAIRHRDKVVRTLTLRQKWPRNMSVNLMRPRWQASGTFSPFPSNILYERPRSIDRTDPGPGGEPPSGLITQSPALSHGGVSEAALLATYGKPTVLSASIPELNVVTFTWEGGHAPFDLDPGDGSSVLTGVSSGVTHDYTAAGSGEYTAVLSDAIGQESSAAVSITVAAADPWDSMTTHAAIDAWVEENGIEQPVGWSAMTIAQKKEWLDNNA